MTAGPKQHFQSILALKEFSQMLSYRQIMDIKRGVQEV